jgi:glycosyltransferase involved in cell wall biosynthesis
VVPVNGRGLIRIPLARRPRPQLAYKAGRRLGGHGVEREVTAAYLKVFRSYDVSAVLAEYGDHAGDAVAACQQAALPLVVHFHGYDASETSVVEANREGYQRLFRHAAAIVTVSHAMHQRLRGLGAPVERLFYNPYGVDCLQFEGGAPGTAPPVLAAVGRFTEKKAPQVTLRAFAKARARCPRTPGFG